MQKLLCIVLTIVLVQCIQAQIVQDCVTDAYPPPKNRQAETYTINLDLPAAERWVAFAQKEKAGIANLLASFKKFIRAFGSAGDKIISYVDTLFPKLAETLPQPYRDELQGMAKGSGLQSGEIVLLNIFYELFTVCTSIVAEDPNGDLYHARNLDFGLFMGWDQVNHTWAISEALRPIVLNMDFQRSGKTVYKMAGFAGYIGMLTGIKPGIFTVSMDERFNLDGGFIGVFEWIIGQRDGSWTGFLGRDVLEKATSFKEAQDMLSDTKMLAPAYFILGGNSSGEGLVITRDRKSTVDTWTMAQAGKWYILETNYDHWKNPLFFDDRRTPANKCMTETKQNGVGFKGLFNVLSTQPVLNKLTTYTALMHVKSGQLETYVQDCPGKCTPW